MGTIISNCTQRSLRAALLSWIKLCVFNNKDISHCLPIKNKDSLSCRNLKLKYATDTISDPSGRTTSAKVLTIQVLHNSNKISGDPADLSKVNKGANDDITLNDLSFVPPDGLKVMLLGELCCG
eukprot:9097550-Ditylum_brightwellii.AAC.1